jgi:hypothetical protein
MSERNKVLDRAASRLREITINELFEKNLNATGNLVKSIQYVAEPTQVGNALYLEMEEYGFILDSGRGPASTKSSVSWRPSLIEWIKARNIRPKPGITVEQLSYAIYNSINKNGYKARPFINSAISTYIDQFAQEYAEATANDIEINLKDRI